MALGVEERGADRISLLFGTNENLFKTYDAFVRHGAGTTRQVSAFANIGLLSLRPRATRLKQMGLLTQVGTLGGEGIYRAETSPEKVEYAMTLLL